jgi:hypothetical protein
MPRGHKRVAKHEIIIFAEVILGNQIKKNIGCLNGFTVYNFTV